MHVRSTFSPTSIGAPGHMINVTAATIIISIANASSATSATMAVAARTNVTTERVPPSAKKRTSSPVASTASMPSTRTMSAVPPRTIKQNHAQTTTTSTGTKVAITKTIATKAAMISHAGAHILPCLATAKQA